MSKPITTADQREAVDISDAMLKARGLPTYSDLVKALRTCGTDMPGTRFKAQRFDEHLISSLLSRIPR